MGKRATRDVPAKKDFTRWYPYIVEAADLVDKRYPIKGMDVWRPYGLKMMRLIDGLTHREMERTGHEEVRFPLLIPDHLLEKENRLVALLKRAREEGVDPSELRIEDDGPGFAKEVYWVRQAGENDLEVPMFLRPTSETAMYTMFPLWIRSHADLPLKTYQIVNTFRYETKQTRSFIRVREIHFFEAHTAHIDEDDATRQIEEDLGYYIMQWSLLPALPGTKRLGDRSSTQAKVTTKVRTRRREASQKGNAFAASVKAAATDAGLEGFEDFGAATAAAASLARRQRESEIARA